MCVCLDRGCGGVDNYQGGDFMRGKLETATVTVKMAADLGG